MVGGRFSEIAQGAPSADAVVGESYPGPCHDALKSTGVAGFSRYDYYTDSTKIGCEKFPDDGSSVWYFSYMSKTGGYFNYYQTDDPPKGYVITMAYDAKDVNVLPKKGSAKLKAMLLEMTSIIKSLSLKQVAEAITQSEATKLAVARWGDCSSECEKMTVTIEQNLGTTYVVALFEGLHDDSISSSRFVAPVSYRNNAWTLEATTEETQKCAEGRGHQDFSEEPCI